MKQFIESVLVIIITAIIISCLQILTTLEVLSPPLWQEKGGKSINGTNSSC